MQQCLKRTLVVVSHAIEQAAIANVGDEPMVVVALFQRPEYFQRAERNYRRIARHSLATVVAAVGLTTRHAEDGLGIVSLDKTEDLAREWAVVVLTPSFGAALVATDQEEVHPDAETLEGGRLFHGSWQVGRDQALRQVMRLRTRFAERLNGADAEAIDSVIERAEETLLSQADHRTDALVKFFVQQIESERRRRRAVQAELETVQRRWVMEDLGSVASPDGGRASAPVLDDDSFRRWAVNGVTASGTLPVALIGIRLVHETISDEGHHGAVAVAALEVARVLARLLRPMDRAVRIGDGDFMLVLPSVELDDAIRLANRIIDDVAELARQQFYLPVSARSVVTTTRDRPLPVGAVKAALHSAMEQGLPVLAMSALSAQGSE